MLIDTYGRTVNYLRISITDRCDLRCNYCIPKGFTEFEKPVHWLSFDDIERVVRQFALLGTRRFRLTGGEPLLRKDLVSLVKRLKAIEGVEDLSLSTNATQLSRYAKALYEAGLDRLNISLDSLSAHRMQEITGFDVKEKVMNGLQAARDAGFKNIKINMVVSEINQHEVEDMLKFCLKNHYVLRLIELMPMGTTGQQQAYVNLQPIIEKLSQRYHLKPSQHTYGGGPARYWDNQDHSFSIGYITPMSQHFCASCNRVRLAVDGTLYMCLGQEHQYALAPLLKSQASDQALNQAIQTAIHLKPQQHDFMEQPLKIVRFMSKTGG